MTLITIACLALQFCLLATAYWFERRISRIEISVVRQIMEESPELTTQVLKTLETLRNQQIMPDKALKEARRLHGLDP
jgi:hypothetical protein